MRYRHFIHLHLSYWLCSHLYPSCLSGCALWSPLVHLETRRDIVL
uniref:Uncharacterized protein n=1 Tax=Arundo donax TaxID=35708 RepID=A0A0A8ZPD4_ARUDO